MRIFTEEQKNKITEDDPYAISGWMSRMNVENLQRPQQAISTFRGATDTAAEYCMKRGEYGAQFYASRSPQGSNLFLNGITYIRRNKNNPQRKVRALEHIVSVLVPTA